VLIEVKLSPEETKAGLEPGSDEAARLLERLPDLEFLETRGLMTMRRGRGGGCDAGLFPSFAGVAGQVAAAHSRLKLDALSMGMSGDFSLAIEEGATRIRIGTALFGKRAPWKRGRGNDGEPSDAAWRGGWRNIGGSGFAGSEEEDGGSGSLLRGREGAAEDCGCARRQSRGKLTRR